MAMKREPESKENMTKILVVDDHPVMRHGLTQLVNQEGDLRVCGEAGEAHTAIEAIVALRPDMVIVDISLKGVDGIELIKKIRVRDEPLPILVLSMHDESLYAERALRAGANGYIMKEEPAEQLVRAIRHVLSGKIYVSDNIGSKLLQKVVDHRPPVSHSLTDSLSDRELEVFQFLGQGLRTRQIAEVLHVSVKTVESYRERIKDKMELTDATELLLRAVQWVHSEHSN